MRSGAECLSHINKRTYAPIFSATSGSSEVAVSSLERDLGAHEIELIDEIWNAVATTVSSSEDSPQKDAIEQTLQTFLPRMSPALILKLRQTPSEYNTDASVKLQAIGNALNNIIEQKLQQSKDLLHAFLTAGEIRKLDGLIGKAAASGQLDSSFFAVLNANINDAYKEQMEEEQKRSGMSTTESTDPNEANRLQILRHVYTRCQEEVEKNVQPGVALLNKILRTDQVSIRANQLRHYLGKPEEKMITTPDGKQIPLKNTGKALVPPSDLVLALANAVAQVRQVEKAGGTDRETAANLVESCRQVAIEARLALGELYGVDSTELQEFEAGLMPVFRAERGSVYSPE